MKELFKVTPRIRSIALCRSTDGRAVTNVAVGSHRTEWRSRARAAGWRVRHGKSDGCYGSRDRQDPGDAVPKQPKTTFNVGRVGGGTSVNSIPFDAWMEVDM
jgi:hypothetical protein